MKTLLTRNHCEFIIVDDEDFDRIKPYKWRINNGSIQAVVNGKLEMLSNFIMGTNRTIDHKDRNPFNNQRENFRFCNNSLNRANSKLNKSNTSGFRGVSWHKISKKWRATIRQNGYHTHIGYYHSKKEAALAYNKKAIEIFGEFAYQNEVTW